MKRDKKTKPNDNNDRRPGKKSKKKKSSFEEQGPQPKKRALRKGIHDKKGNIYSHNINPIPGPSGLQKPINDTYSSAESSYSLPKQFSQPRMNELNISSDNLKGKSNGKGKGVKKGVRGKAWPSKKSSKKILYKKKPKLPSFLWDSPDSSADEQETTAKKTLPVLEPRDKKQPPPSPTLPNIQRLRHLRPQQNPQQPPPAIEQRHPPIRRDGYTFFHYRKRFLQRYNIYENIYKVKFARRFHGTPLTQLHELLTDLFQQIILNLNREYHPDDRVRLYINHPGLLYSKPIFIALRPLRNLTVESIMNAIEKVLNSNQNLPLD